jgi:hypothetical protein
MPSARERLRQIFSSDAEALAVLNKNFTVSRGGVIQPRVSEYKATSQEYDALDYLMMEWDYDYMVKCSATPTQQ